MIGIPAALTVCGPGGVEISEGVLYRARIAVPARVPVGNYTAETFLIRGGRIIASAVRDIRIEKSGFERFVADAAEHWSLTYGLSAVAISLREGGRPRFRVSDVDSIA